MSPADAPESFRIGTVTRLTSLTAETLRAWERRHRAVSPRRTPGGARLYSDGDVQRLLLLRALTERGDPIGAVASLSDTALRRRLERVAQPTRAASPTPEPERAPRIAVIDPILHAQLRAGAAEAAGLEIAASGASLEALDLNGAPGALDALVVGFAALGDDPPAALERMQARLAAPVAIVLYEFARRAQLGRLERRGVRLLRGPVRAQALEGAVREALAAAGIPARSAAPRTTAAAKTSSDGVPPPRFDEAQLGRLREIRSSVECECPNHLAALILSLGSFERYSAECASRSPEDAALHRMLARETGRARGIVEAALERLCAEDGLAL